MQRQRRMKGRHFIRRARSAHRNRRHAVGRDAGSASAREGSVIVVVLVLTIGLLILGMLLYTDAAQEDINAEYYADAAKVDEPLVDTNQIAFEVLRQIILGANDAEKHSPFYGGWNSLLPRMFGSDRIPFNGPGVHVSGDPTTGMYFVDQDFDGNPDGNNTPMQMNHSPAANGTDRANGVFINFPQPDAGYTYPDLNSPYVFYRGLVRDPNTGSTRTVMIPSYFRPQILRNLAGIPPAQWYTALQTANLIMRPHAEHRALDSNGQVAKFGSSHPNSGQEIRRFISALHPEPTAPGVPNFPFPIPRLGAWTGDGNSYELDVDLDGDGIKESIYMDLDLGLFELPDGSKKFVPLVAAKLVPLDSLFNLNAHGNVAKIIQANGSAFPNRGGSPWTGFLHGSNQGVSRSEVNPQYGLILQGFPSGSNAAQHQAYYGRLPAATMDLADMEYWWLLTGRPVFQGSSITELIAGRWGEVSRMKNAFQNPSPTNKYPLPGKTGVDDNGNGQAGGAFTDGSGFVFPQQVVFFAHGQPLDFRGRGTFVSNVTRRNVKTIGRQKFPWYQNYYINLPQWPATLSGQALITGQVSPLVDEPDEMLLDPALVTNQTSDSPFDASQTVSLHMADSHLATTQRDNDRVLQLAPHNFRTAANAEKIRKLFTTVSRDIQTHGISRRPNFRTWEFTNVGGGVAVFPPTFPNAAPGTDPLRGEVRELLMQRAGDTTLRPLQRRLSVNKILDRYPPPGVNQLGNLRFRPLTPHVTGTDPNTGVPLLPASPVSGNNSVVVNRFGLVRPEQIGTNPATRYLRQEWLARYDRQRLCRDLFTLLYLVGGANDLPPYNSTDNVVNPVTGAGTIYSRDQLREMAQFVVNLVDNRDEDDIPTIFEYDTNLNNGWNLDDDPFTDRSPAGVPESDRAVVIGVERQQLCFSEALTFLAKRTTDMMGNGTNHNATDYDDSTHHLFTYIELQNVIPQLLNFNNEQWQIVVRGNTADPTKPKVSERRLTFRPSVGGIAPAANGSDQASRFTIGTQNDRNYVDSNGNIKPSHFRANPLYGDDPASVPIRLVPRVGLSLDLMKPLQGLNSYRINEAPGSSSSPGEGPTITGTPTDPPGGKLLTLVNADGTPITDPATLDGVQDSEITVILQLRRRLHPHRMPPSLPGSGGHQTQSADNPWIVVDEISVPLRVFHLSDPNVQKKTVRDELLKVRSTERIQPLDGTALGKRAYPTTGIDTSVVPPDPTVYRLNSFHTVNRATLLNLPGGNFTLWQPQFDRPYASIAEVLSLPLYGGTDERVNSGDAPRYRTYVTEFLGTGGGSNNKIALRGINPDLDPRTAVSRFLRPDLPTQTIQPPGNPITNRGNRWYRWLSLVDVPDPNPQAQPWFVDNLGRLGSPVFSTTEGLLNLNTLSHPAHLAGLLDAPDTLALNNGGAGSLNDTFAGPRNWWDQFLRARDRVDPLTGLTLPGVPGVSRPFRDFSDALAGNFSLEHTLLRSLPQDGSPLNGRRLFEIGSLDQHNNWQNYGTSHPNSIDVTTRYRLLSKVLNNTTNRGNVFLLILRIEYFEAVEVDADNGEKVVRIGGKLPGNQSPDLTIYYVIDRTRAFDLIRNNDLPKLNAGRFTWSFNQQFDFRPLILHEQRVE